MYYCQISSCVAGCFTKARLKILLPLYFSFKKGCRLEHSGTTASFKLFSEQFGLLNGWTMNSHCNTKAVSQEFATSCTNAYSILIFKA